MAVASDGRLIAGRSEIAVIDCRPLSQRLREEREAKGLLHWLFHRPLLKTEVAEAVQRDPTISDTVRRIALQFLNSYRDRPDLFNNSAWRIAYESNETAEQYRRALEYAATANRLDAVEPEFLVTMAVAQYRNGRFRDTVDTLEKLNAKERSEFPETELVRAMAEFQIGRHQVAREILLRARTDFKGRKGTEENLKQTFDHFRAEAEALIVTSTDEKG